jgi:predicted TIM-barrel fold metal-dependent hydrolase
MMAGNTAIDRLVYEEEIDPWLPGRIIDCHCHVGLPEHCGPVSPERYKEIWALEVGLHQSWEEMRDNYRALFPRQEVSALVFGGVHRELDTARGNDYVLAGLSEARNNAEGLLVTRPEWDAGKITEAMSNGFLGIKPYPDLAPQGGRQASIYDFVPREHLAAVNRLSGILMLHLPRPGRLGDPDNIRELIEISELYPSIKLIVPHIGRAFCLPTAKRGLPHFAGRSGVYFDTSANLNADVFQYALETVGPDRLLFGSDLPVTMMRGVREHVGERYINYTDGPYSWNTNRKSPEEEANYTYYLYEELRALIKAIQRSGLGIDSMEKMLYSNSARLFGKPVGSNGSAGASPSRS